MKEDAGHHEVGRPVVNRSEDVSKRQLSHDVLHASVGRGWVAFSTGNVVDTEDRTRDDEDDEGKEGNAPEAVKWIPIPNDSEFVLLSVSKWHLTMHIVVSALGHIPVILEAETGIKP